MNYKIQDSDIEVLRNAGVSENDIEHCRAVADKAVEIARRTGAALDMELVARGALFHDLGKAKTHEITHGKVGAELWKALGLPKEVNAIMEKHIRGGLTEEEAVELGLPVKDYALKSSRRRSSSMPTVSWTSSTTGSCRYSRRLKPKSGSRRS